MPQAVPVSTCPRIISQTGCGTDILATVGQVIIVLEAIVLWTGKATLPLVVASFSLGLIVEIDGDGSVYACHFGGLSHVSSPCRGLSVKIRHREGHALKDQAYGERIGTSPRNPMECVIFHLPLEPLIDH